jgi:replicative superfamily II helicase
VRRTVEELARRQIVHTVVSTTTLAEGVDLPFRAVVLCRLALPYGEPLRRARIRNIRGRAARPRYSSDGVFVVIEPEKTNTDAYQHFLDHYWEGTVDAVEAQSGLIDLFAVDRLRRAGARRSLQRQLLALYSEQQIELQDTADVAQATLLEIASGPDSPVARKLRALSRSRHLAGRQYSAA